MSNDSPKKGKLYSGLSVTKDVLYSMFVRDYNLKLHSTSTTLYVLLRTKEKIRYHEVWTEKIVELQYINRFVYTVPFKS